MVPSESFENEKHDEIEDDSIYENELEAGNDIDNSSNPYSEPELTEPIVAQIDGAEPTESAVRDYSQLLKPPSAIAGKARMPIDNAINLDVELHNMSAIGGAVGGFVLGLWSMICSLITYFGFINAMLAIVLGIYGLSSSRKRLATVGIILGICGLCMSLMEINEILGDYLLEQQDASENF